MEDKNVRKNIWKRLYSDISGLQEKEKDEKDTHTAGSEIPAGS